MIMDPELDQPHLRQHYLANPYIIAARARTREDPRIQGLLRGDLRPEALAGFLLEFCALGVRMVQNADVWMSQAGAACVRAGRRRLGESIARRAADEAGQDALLVDDLLALEQIWERRFGGRVELDRLMFQPPPRAVLRYVELHQRVIAGPCPWALLGIEYEIETMTLVLGPPLIERCRASLGASILDAMSFVRTHVERDEARAQANAGRIEALLAREPHLAGELARAGAEAIELDLDFLGGCVDLGMELARTSARRSRAA